jgi:predicted amidohydrolase
MSVFVELFRVELDLSTLQSEKFKIALCQCTSVLGDEQTDPRVANLEKALELIKHASSLGAKLVVFGEIYLTGYESYEYLSKYASFIEPPDQYIERLVRAAKENHVYVIMGTATHSDAPLEDLFNSTILVGPEGVIGKYSKTHLAAFTTGPAGKEVTAVEKLYWSPGQEIPVFDTPLGRIGIQICYDIYFPEVARLQTILGAHLLVCTSAAVSGYEDTWNILLRARAIENQIWVAMCSVVGKQKDHNFFGGSRILDPTGLEIVRAKDNQEDVVIGEVDYRKMRQLREQVHYFGDRNPRLYAFARELTDKRST